MILKCSEKLYGTTRLMQSNPESSFLLSTNKTYAPIYNTWKRPHLLAQKLSFSSRILISHLNPFRIRIRACAAVRNNRYAAQCNYKGIQIQIQYLPIYCTCLYFCFFFKCNRVKSCIGYSDSSCILNTSESFLLHNFNIK